MVIFDNLVERMLKNVASQYIPKLQNVVCERANELTVMKGKVRACPEEVEAWFDKEIEKLRNVDVSDLIHKFNVS
jgi:hypothetical protein